MSAHRITATPAPQDVAKYRAAARRALTDSDPAWRAFALDLCLELEVKIGRNRARGIENAIRRQLRRERAEA